MKGFWGILAKYLVVLTNTLVFLAGCLVFGFSIYALFTDNDLMKILDQDEPFNPGYINTSSKPNSNLSEIIFAIASAIIIIISLLGCCGAFKENRCAIFIYFSIILLITLTMLTGVTIVANRSIDQARPPLISSLKRYHTNPMNDTEIEITKSWNQIQIENECCGVDSYKDWSNITYSTMFPDIHGNKVPISCCIGLKTSDEVLNCQKNPDNLIYQHRMDGCYTKLEIYFKNNKKILELVSVIILIAMVLNLILLFGFALCMSPTTIKKGYEEV